MGFKNQTVWITGASSGIGEALAYAFARQGAKLVLSSRRPEELERVRLACEHPELHHVAPLDLQHSANFPQIVREVTAQAGHIDILINNGGISQRGLAVDTPLEVERRLMEVDYFGPVALTKALLPHLRAHKAGRIVVISSVMGYVGTPMRSSYSAAKHALHGYFDSLRAELHDEGIKVTIVCPGYVSTGVSRNALTATGAPQGFADSKSSKGIPATACAGAILRAISKDRNEIAIGGKEVFGIYLQRFFPSLLTRLVRKMDFGQKRRESSRNPL